MRKEEENQPPAAVAVPVPEEVVREVRNRLRRVEGQIGAILRMIDERRECRDVVLQLSAASRALESARIRVLVSGMRYCAEHPEEAGAAGYTLDEFERLLLSAR